MSQSSIGGALWCINIIEYIPLNVIALEIIQCIYMTGLFNLCPCGGIGIHDVLRERFLESGCRFESCLGHQVYKNEKVLL